MFMEDLNIMLIFNSGHFREMYYQNNRGNIFKYKPTQTAILYCLFSALITFLIFLASFKKPEISWLIFPGAIFFLFTGIYAIYAVTKQLNWISGIEKYLKEMAAYIAHQLKLTSAALELIQDSKITIERWANIKSAQIFDDHIMLYKSDGPAFIFPAKSMKAEEFLKLKDFIINKITIPVKE